MNLVDKIKKEKADIMYYCGIYDLANNKIKKLDEELIPSFIIEEALEYFCDLEEYEKCQLIKTFFDENPIFIVNSTRIDWFGIPEKKKQNS